MKITTNLKKRFCKDYNIPINLFKEPYFSDRIELLNPLFNTINKWNIFINELSNYNNEEEYFCYYNSVKENAICSIKNSDGYKRFCEENFTKKRFLTYGISNHDIYKESNDNKCFISIDLVKANFSVLNFYDKSIFSNIFGESNTWEEFMSKFTDNKHIINSKYIRQVILGNCNPKRHTSYEKYITGIILNKIIDNVADAHNFVQFTEDELVLDVTEFNIYERNKIKNDIENISNEFPVQVKIELFELHKIKDSEIYYKKILISDNKYEIKFKNLSNYDYPFIVRNLLKQGITESDKMFYFNKVLSKFIEIPNFEINEISYFENEKLYLK